MPYRAPAFHEKVVIGVELEGYTILLPRYEISRKMAFHRKGVGERGERFVRDWSIGTEYNSRPFNTIREGLFLLKTGLRKYNTQLYGSTSSPRRGRQIFLVGGWRDRFAGAHIHLSIAGRKMSFADAKRLAAHLHDHLPLLIAMTANSPVWADRIGEVASHRVIKGSKKYFHPISRRTLSNKAFDEMTFSNRRRKTKPPTLEIRVMDSNIPEYIMAAACVVKAASLASLRRRPIANNVTYFQYLRGRQDAARRGMRSRLCWNGEWMPATEYLDRVIWAYRRELAEMDIPQEIWVVFKMLKKGFNGSHMLYRAAVNAHRRHPQTWQRRFARLYVNAINSILGGNSLLRFIHELRLQAPHVSRVWLGRRQLRLL